MAEPEPYPRGPTVLYIGGTGRTGSTLLTRLLGARSGWFAGGELAFLWRYGLVEHGRCGCGCTVRRCPVWSDVLAAAAAAGATIDADRMVALRRRCWSVHLPLMVHPWMARRLMDRLEELPATVETLYRCLAEVTGARVIVDSSKEPHYSWILRDRTSLDVRFLHLVRDPRAVAYSWSRHRPERGLAGDVLMERRGPLRAALYYDVSDVAAEAIWSGRPGRYGFLRYEDLVQRPGPTLAAVARFAGEDADDPADGRRFQVGPGHVVWGNPDRFDTAVIDVRDDDAWRDELGPLAAAVTMVATGVVARRYGYPWRRHGELQPVRARRLADARLDGAGP